MDVNKEALINENIDCLCRSNKQLTELPENLPNLTHLYCNDNQLTRLPVYPKLIGTICEVNKITEIPYLPNLESMYCRDNLLTKISDLPKLQYLDCRGNTDLKIPYLVKLRGLLCSGCKHFKAAGITDITSYRKFLDKVNVIVTLLIWASSINNSKNKLTVDLIKMIIYNNYLALNGL
jgi:Leucine-rich repeat (LRR) protein